MDELNEILNCMANGKASGVDGTPTEQLEK